MTRAGFTVALVGLESLGKETGNVSSTAGHKYGDVLTISPRSTRSAQRSFGKLIDRRRRARLEPPASSPRSYSWSAVCGPSTGGRTGKMFAAETAEGAEMIGMNDHPDQSLRSPRALR